jgi:hypothetical protein
MTSFSQANVVSIFDLESIHMTILHAVDRMPEFPVVKVPLACTRPFTYSPSLGEDDMYPSSTVHPYTIACTLSEDQ